MIASPDMLRDGAAIQHADSAGLLPAVASAGAQVRAVAAQWAQFGGLARVERPRAMLVTGTTAGVDAAMLSALLGSGAAVPVLAANSVPSWVGPLDLVVVLASRVHDEQAAMAAAAAARRGAALVVRAAEQGSVGFAAGAALVPATIAVPEALAVASRWSLLAAVAAGAGLMPEPDLPTVADALDVAAVRLHPRAESFVNQAINLAEYLSDRTPLFVAADPLADAVAAHAGAVFADLAGLAAAVLPSAPAALSPRLLDQLGAARDLFADPFDDDGPRPPAPVLLSAQGDGGPGYPAGARALLAGLRRALPGAVELDGVPAAAEPGAAGDWRRFDQPDPTSPVEPAIDRAPGRPDPLRTALTLALQIDFAAVYLALIRGTQLPHDFPEGLGHTAGTRWAVRTTTVDAVGPRDADEDW